jgi:hypothetical protein
MSEAVHLVELGLSRRYARAHAWAVHAVTGFLSAYYLEEPRLRLSRRYEDMETGTHVWVCEVETAGLMPRLITRLLVDLPEGEVRQPQPPDQTPPRYLIDLSE